MNSKQGSASTCGRRFFQGLSWDNFEGNSNRSGGSEGVNCGVKGIGEKTRDSMRQGYDMETPSRSRVS